MDDNNEKVEKQECKEYQKENNSIKDIFVKSKNESRSDSDEINSDDCFICFEKINEQDLYAKIENNKEGNMKYHPQCLNKWLSIKGNGIVSREHVESYNLYSNENFVGEIKVASPLLEEDNREAQDVLITINDRHMMQDRNTNTNTNNDYTKYFCGALILLLFIYMSIKIF